MKNKIKGLLALALAAFTSLTWAAELVIPYTFDGKAGNTEIPFEYKVAMPEEALSTFTVTVKYTGGNHRVEILGVKLLDGETEYTAVATGTDGTKVVEEGVSYSGGNNYNNIFTFTNEAGFTANKVYTLQAMLQVNNANPSHNGNIKVSGGLIRLTPTYWASFDNSNVSSDKVWNSGGISFGAGASSGYVLVPLGNKAFDLSYDAYGQQTFLSANPTAFTLSLNAKTGTAANGILIAFGSKNSTGGLVVRRGADWNEIIVTKAKSTDAIITANAPGSSVGYTNIVLTYENETLSLYINGELAGTADVAAGELIPGMNFQLGRRYGGLVDGSKEANNVNGAIDELAAWNGTALTANQVKAFYNENYADALKNTSIALFYEFEGTDAATFGNKAWDYNSPSSGNSSAEATYHNSARTMSGDIAYKSVVLDKNVHPGMSYSWPEEFTIATYVNLSECKTDGTIVSIGKSLLLRKIDRIRMALCNNGEIQYVWAEDENLSIGYHLIVVRKTATSLSLQIDDGPAQVVVLAEGNSPEITDGLQLGVRWEGGYESYDNTDDGIGVGPHLDDFLVWNGALSDASVANLCAIYPEILTEVVSAEPDGVGPHKLSDLITNGLKTGDNVIATVTLADGATLEIDQALNFSELEIVSSGSIKVKVSDLTITQAQLNAIINTNGVRGTVSTDYEEHLEGYTVNGVTYPLIFRGTTDANWTTLSNWYTGYRRNSTDIYWIPYTGTVVPGAHNSNEWRATLFDGKLMAIADGEDGYKTVTLPNTIHYEGWETKIAAYNGVHVVIGHANKFQSNSGFLRVDDTSKITFQAYGDGNGGGDKSIYVNAENGVVFAEGTTSGIQNMTYYFDADGSVAFATLNQLQKIAGLVLDLGDSTLTGRRIVSRKLIGFTAGNATFTVAENAVTTTAEDVTLETADILQVVGQYKFEKKDDGYYVSFVAYAETDEIGAMNTWTATVDGNWNTVGNWSSGFVPASGKNATISITADTTITIPSEGVTVGALEVTGEGTLTIAGGKITAGEIFANTSIVADEDTLALAPMKIAQDKTVTYTTTIVEEDADDINNVNHALSLKAMTGAGTFMKKGTGVIGLFATAAEPAIVVEEGAIYVREAPTTAMNIAAKAGAEIRLAAWQVNFANTANKITLDGGTQLTLANGANVSGTITIANAAETAAKICGSSFNASTIAATITGAGKVEFADGGMFNPTHAANKIFPCQYATTYSGVISGGLQVIISDTSAVTFTGANTYTGGTMIVAGATLNAGTGSLGTGAVTGAGTLVIPGYPTNANVRNSLGAATWTGTYVNTANNTLADDGDWLGAVGNENSTVEFTGTNSGYLKQAGSMDAALKVTGSITFNNGFSTDGGYTFNGALLGTGTLATQNGQTDVLKFLGETKDFAGTITVAGGHCIAFGEQADTDNNSQAGKIVIAAGKTANIAAGKTWTAVNGIEVAGTIGGEGTIGSTLILLNGATLANALTLEGNVTVAEGVDINHAYATAAGDTVITCENAEAVASALTGAPQGLKYVAENGAVKLAVAKKTNFVVTVGENAVNCETFAEALDALGTTGGSLQIAADADEAALAITEPIVITADAIIDLNGKTLTGSTYPVIRIQNGATVTIKNGTITNNDYVFVLGASDQTSAGNLTIESGTYTGVTTLASVTKGTLTITGGTFEVTDDGYGMGYLLNCYDPSYKAGVAKIEVTGGKFKGFNPANNGAEGPNTNFCAEGYTATEGEDGYWTVAAIPVSNNVAKIGETEYETLEAAFTAAKEMTDSVTVTLLKDIGSENSPVVVAIPECKSEITFDMGGFKVVGGIDTYYSAKVTIKNGTIESYNDDYPIHAKKGHIVLRDINMWAKTAHGLRLEGSSSSRIKCEIYGGTYNSGNYTLYAKSHADMIVYSGTVFKGSNSGGYALNLQDGTTVTVNGGTFSGTIQANGTTSILTINGGFFKNTITNGSGTENIFGGYFVAKQDSSVKTTGYTFVKTDEYADYPWTSVKADYALTVNAENAEVSELNATYQYEDEVSFTVTPASGYKVTSVKLGTEELTAVDGNYTFKMPAEAVTITVTTEAASTFDVTIGGDTFANADALKAEANSTTTMTVPETSTWTAEGNILKKDGEAYVEFADYYTVVVNGTTVTLKLNKPVIGESAEGADDAFTVTADAVTIKITNYNKDLNYGVRIAADINGLKTAEITEVETEDGVITLTKSGDSAFFEVVVSDVDFPATPAK